MKADGKHLDAFRVIHPTLGASAKGSLYGYFVVQLKRASLRIISSGEQHGGELGDWEHVSVSLMDRCPTWDEMCFVKDLFWDDEECAVQFHPAKSAYINFMPYCLHLWKSKQAIKLPPSIAVAPEVPVAEKKKMSRSFLRSRIGETK